MDKTMLKLFEAIAVSIASKDERDVKTFVGNNPQWITETFHVTPEVFLKQTMKELRWYM